MSDARPDPDALLARAKAEEPHRSRGRLKVFFGMAPGVGKTYAMIGAGREKLIEGIDVVVGYAEPHARPETEELLLGMELLPFRFVEHRGVRLKEFDLDAALARKPQLVLVDELAHTNAPGLRHAKRCQDIDELLAAGIDVFTTVNVQHLESLNDIVAQITGVIVRETIPDSILEQADEVELVDLPPDDLIDRLREGKVYVAGQAERAVQGFFKKSNLIALRELALRWTAERVNAQVQSAHESQLVRHTWPTRERILVGVSPSPSNATVIRAAKRMATALRAEWIAVFVETPKLQHLTDHARQRLIQNFQLAERLGAKTATLSGHALVDEFINYARSRNVTKIVVGKSQRPRWLDNILGSPIDNMIRRSGEIDVYVVHGETEEKREPFAKPRPIASTPPAAYWQAVAIVTLATGLCFAMYPYFALSNLIMVYLLGVAAVAARFGQLPAVLASLLSVLLFDFCFVPPRWTFAVSDTEYFVTFGVMLAIGLIISRLTSRIRDQADTSRRRERRTEALYRMTDRLAAAKDRAELVEIAVGALREVFNAEAMLLLPEDQNKLAVARGGELQQSLKESEMGVAQWAFEHGQLAGAATDTLPSSECLYLPLMVTSGAVGIVGLRSPMIGDLLAPDQRQTLDAFVDQVALAVERQQLAEAAHISKVQAEAEKLRSSLLSAVSHDLRTPLAVITGASSSLLDSESSATQTSAARHDLLQTIYDESDRLNRLVGNLLDITRLESGAVRVNKQWQPVEEIVGSALRRLDSLLKSFPASVSLPADLPMVKVDGVLIEQVLINLIENAAKYCAPHTPIDISATARNSQVIIEVADRGPGLAAGEESRVFDKFFRGSAAGNQRGAGLGLAICRSIVEVHGGRMSAENRAGGGAVFRFTIPVEGSPPVMPSETPPSARTHG